jgi:hypothetical protein
VVLRNLAEYYGAGKHIWAGAMSDLVKIQRVGLSYQRDAEILLT